MLIVLTSLGRFSPRVEQVKATIKKKTHLLMEFTKLHFFKNALNKSIGSGRNVVVLCSLAISRMVWR